MRLSSGYEARRGRIEIVPLIDVIFLLLVFFLYAMVAMVYPRGVRVALPGARGATESPDALVVTLTADNGLFLGEARAERRDVLRQARARPGRPVLIRADREADVGPAIELVSALRQEGVEKVSFLVRGEEAPAAPVAP